MGHGLSRIKPSRWRGLSGPNLHRTQIRDAPAIGTAVISVFILNPLEPGVDPRVVQHEATGGKTDSALMLRKLPDLCFYY